MHGPVQLIHIFSALIGGTLGLQRKSTHELLTGYDGASFIEHLNPTGLHHRGRWLRTTPKFGFAVQNVFDDPWYKDIFKWPSIAEVLHPQVHQPSAATWVSADSGNMLPSVLFSLAFSGVAVTGGILAFSFLRQKFSIIYSYNMLRGTVTQSGSHSLFGWIRTVWRLRTDQIAQTVTLDAALQIEFIDLCMNIFKCVGVPLLLVLCPLHILVGHALKADGDILARLSMHSVESKSCLLWVHGVAVLYVVFVTVHMIYGAQQQFTLKRKLWLCAMPAPRSTTVLVQRVPDEILFSNQSADQALEEYFNKVFPKATILNAFVVDETHSGFATFEDRYDMELAMTARLSLDEQDFIMSYPPDPSDVLYECLETGSGGLRWGWLLGYILVLLLFFSFIPVVACISAFTSLETLSSLRWVDKVLHVNSFIRACVKGVVSSLALNLWLSLLPCNLSEIFTTFFPLKAETWVQLHVQKWYFGFLLTFILLATTLGRSFLETASEIVQAPTLVFSMLASTLPQASTWYMNYIITVWATHLTELFRYKQLFLFLSFRNAMSDEDARLFAEPENKVSSGIGSRTASISLEVAIGFAFCQFSPLISVLVFLDLALCRLYYGYLLLYAEAKKTDLGGYFWVSQLEFVFVGLTVYCLFMSGILFQRSAEWTNVFMAYGPAFMGFIALCYLAYSWYRFDRAFKWEQLTLEDVVKGGPADSSVHRTPSCSKYEKPKLVNHAQHKGKPLEHSESIPGR